MDLTKDWQTDDLCPVSRERPKTRWFLQPQGPAVISSDSDVAQKAQPAFAFPPLLPRFRLTLPLAGLGLPSGRMAARGVLPLFCVLGNSD